MSWQHRQTDGNGGATNPRTITQTLNPVSGNLLIAHGSWEAAAITFSSIADTLGNTWVQVGSELNVNNRRSRVYYAENCIGGGANTITWNFSGVPNPCDLFIAEYTDVQPTGSLDTSATSSLTGAGTLTGNITPSRVGALIWAAATTPDSVTPPGGIWTTRNTAGSNFIGDTRATTTAQVDYSGASAGNAHLWLVSFFDGPSRRMLVKVPALRPAPFRPGLAR